MPVNVNYLSNSGGTVEIDSPLNKNEVEQNMEIAIFLADNGHKVKLLKIDDLPGTKNPDADIDGKTFEFKTNKRATISSIDNELRKAKNQAGYIVLQIKSGISSVKLSNAISDRLTCSKNVKELWLIYKNKLVKLSRAEFLNSIKVEEEIEK